MADLMFYSMRQVKDPRVAIETAALVKTSDMAVKKKI